MLWFGCGDGPGHLGSEVAFHRCSRSRSSMSNFSAPSSPTFPLLCFISFPECGFSLVAILTLVWNSADRKRLVGQLFPSIGAPPPRIGGTAGRGPPGALQHQGLEHRGCANRRTDRETGHCEQSADTRNGIPDTGFHSKVLASYHFLKGFLRLSNFQMKNTCFGGRGSYGQNEDAGDTCETQGHQHHLFEREKTQKLLILSCVTLCHCNC